MKANRIVLAGTAFASLVLVSVIPAANAASKWAIHEWGTFTSLQNEAGEAIGGINTDDEPVPSFVHGLARSLLLPTTEIPTTFFKGVSSCHPDITMRLETPVIYFHPPPNETGVCKADVRVEFRGGWLTEFYPSADSHAQGLKEDSVQFPHLLSTTSSKLEWNDLKIGGDWPLTKTSEHVWTSPRAVQSARVQTGSGENEQFLFYRGVGHLAAPLKISRDLPSGELLFRSQLADSTAIQPLTVPFLWLVDIRADGKIAYRSLPPVRLNPDSKKILTHTPATFSSSDYTSANRDQLKASLRSALISEGLFADEAQALLNTWELSYFKSSGLRAFFIVPRPWTDFYLPLDVSLPSDINRVMVGRIELVTPEQRHGLQEIAAQSSREISRQAEQLGQDLARMLASQPQDLNALIAGSKSLSASVALPKSYKAYLNLGRFRNALILDEAKQRPSEGLTSFIASYRLQAYPPVENLPQGITAR